MIKLRWSKPLGSDAITYRILRSFIGVHILHTDPSGVEGLTLILSVNASAPQTVTFSGLGLVASQLNAHVIGAEAHAAADTDDGVLLRSNVTAAPGSVEILGGSSLAALGLAVGLRTERSEWFVIADVPAGLYGTEEVLAYYDRDGKSTDYYTIMTINSIGEESRVSPPIKPITGTPGPVCVIEGVVSDVQGTLLADVPVRVSVLALPTAIPGAMVSRKPVVALTDNYGKFSLPLLQGASVMLEIEEIGYSRTFTVPAKDYVDISEIESDFEHRYPLNTEV